MITLESLQTENPTRRRIDISLFYDSLLLYKNAKANVEANGSIVFHPKNGAPIENPYLKIMLSQAKFLSQTNIKCQDFE